MSERAIGAAWMAHEECPGWDKLRADRSRSMDPRALTIDVIFEGFGQFCLKTSPENVPIPSGNFRDFWRRTGIKPKDQLDVVVNDIALNMALNAHLTVGEDGCPYAASDLANGVLWYVYQVTRGMMLGYVDRDQTLHFVIRANGAGGLDVECDLEPTKP